MADTHDTIDGLLAEFRGYSHGMPPSYHVTMSWADFRKMLDRFDAAHKREVATTKESLAVGNSGDCAKLREALETLRELLGDLLRLGDAEYHDDFSNFCDIIDAALAAPPRNCDAMDWRTAWDKWIVKHHPQKPCGPKECYDGTVAFMDWFTAPAAEKEGGKDGNE